MKTVTISRATAAYLKTDLENTIRCYVSPTDGLNGMKGAAIVARWRVLHQDYIRRFPERAKEAKDDEAMMEKKVFPALLDLCEALASKDEAGGCIEPTAEQAAVFRQIGALASPPASVGEVILGLACQRVEMLPGDRWPERIADLNAAVQQFGRGRNTPANNYWTQEDELENAKRRKVTA